jgi:hypothetical protein
MSTAKPQLEPGNVSINTSRSPASGLGQPMEVGIIVRCTIIDGFWAGTVGSLKRSGIRLG